MKTTTLDPIPPPDLPELHRVAAERAPPVPGGRLTQHQPGDPVTWSSGG